MELMPGYKISEAGVIPEDWESRPLSSIGRFKNGINKGSEAFGHGSPFVNLMDVFGENSIKSCDGLGLVKTSDAEQETYDLKLGDVIFIRSSVKPSGVGLTAVVEADLPKTVYSGFLIRFRDGNALDIAFKKHCFYSEKFRSNLIAASTVSANTNINQDNLKKLFIALPPTTAEQRAIAQALSDVDTLLATLDQVIAKKRDLKQASMQQLLAGGIQLAGFGGKWLEVPLGDIVKPQKGQLITTKTIVPGDIPVIAGGKQPAYFHASANRCGKTITVSASGASAGYVAFHAAPIFASDCSTISESEKYCIEFIYYALQLRQEEIYAAQTGGAQPHIQPKDLTPILIKIPEDVKEQAAIASVLSDMDAEITELEARRDKTRNIKQAMMQELLTGKTRLV